MKHFQCQRERERKKARERELASEKEKMENLQCPHTASVYIPFRVLFTNAKSPWKLFSLLCVAGHVAFHLFGFVTKQTELVSIAAGNCDEINWLGN